MIVDVHCHYVPPRFLDLVRREPAFRVTAAAPVGERVDVTVGGIPFALNRTFFDIDRQVACMTALGVDRTVVSLATPFVGYGVDAALGRAATRLFNDEIAALVRAAPDRFAGWAFLPMQSPEDAADELRRAVDELGLAGGNIASNVGGRYLHEDEYAPIFAAASALDVPLFVHPANPPARERMKDYELAVVAGYLFDSTLNLFHMICGGLLDRWPRLRLVITHAGGFALLLRARMQREVDTNPALAATLARPIGDYLKQLWFDSICFEPGYMRYCIETVGADRFLMGSDGPFPLGEPDPVGFVRRALGDGPATARILEANVATLFGPRWRG
ncbi:MAG: amidohydrolase [Alphaproteobacteria bacterium]|nr:amidohydrolase [Alphaproteobacteria bacterium]